MINNYYNNFYRSNNQELYNSINDHNISTNFQMQDDNQKDEEIENSIEFSLSIMYRNFMHKKYKQDLSTIISYLKNSCLELLKTIDYSGEKIGHFLINNFKKIDDKNDINTLKNLKIAYILLIFLDEKHSITKEYEEFLLKLLFKDISEYYSYYNNNFSKEDIPKKYIDKINYLYNVIPDNLDDINENKIKKTKEYIDDFLNNKNND